MQVQSSGSRGGRPIGGSLPFLRKIISGSIGGTLNLINYQIFLSLMKTFTAFKFQNLSFFILYLPLEIIFDKKRSLFSIFIFFKHKKDIFLINPEWDNRFLSILTPRRQAAPNLPKSPFILFLGSIAVVLTHKVKL